MMTKAQILVLQMAQHLDQLSDDELDALEDAIRAERRVRAVRWQGPMLVDEPTSRPKGKLRQPAKKGDMPHAH